MGLLSTWSGGYGGQRGCWRECWHRMYPSFRPQFQMMLMMISSPFLCMKIKFYTDWRLLPPTRILASAASDEKLLRTLPPSNMMQVWPETLKGRKNRQLKIDLLIFLRWPVAWAKLAIMTDQKPAWLQPQYSVKSPKACCAVLKVVLHPFKHDASVTGAERKKESSTLFVVVVKHWVEGKNWHAPCRW